MRQHVAGIIFWCRIVIGMQMETKITDFFQPAPEERYQFSFKKPDACAPVQVKRPVGRPRKQPLQSQGADAAEAQHGHAHDEEERAGSSSPGSSSSGSARIHRRYSHAQKRKIAGYARHHGLRPAERKFGVHRCNIKRWRDDLVDEVRGRKGRFNRKGQGRKTSYPKDIDEALVQWILELRDQQLPVSTDMLKQKALVLIKPGNPSFKASSGWCQKFYKRHSLVFRQKTSVAQKLPKDLEQQIDRFKSTVRDLRAKTDVPPEVLGNMDETPVYFDMLPGKTVEKKGEKTVKVRTTGSEKCHITAVLTATADGQFLPPMIIFKGKTQRTIKKLKVPKGFLVATQEKAWMDDTLMLQYIDRIWKPHVRAAKVRESILTLDSFKAHISESSLAKLSSGNVHTAVIPGGCTSVLQPLDVSLNKPFKVVLRQCWQKYMLEQAEKMQSSQTSGKIPPPSRQDIVDWIEIAWKAVKRKKDAITKSFFVTGIATTFGT